MDTATWSYRTRETLEHTRNRPVRWINAAGAICRKSFVLC